MEKKGRKSNLYHCGIAVHSQVNLSKTSRTPCPPNTHFLPESQQQTDVYSANEDSSELSNYNSLQWQTLLVTLCTAVITTSLIPCEQNSIFNYLPKRGKAVQIRKSLWWLQNHRRESCFPS